VVEPPSSRSWPLVSPWACRAWASSGPGLGPSTELHTSSGSTRPAATHSNCDIAVACRFMASYAGHNTCIGKDSEEASGSQQPPTARPSASDSADAHPSCTMGIVTGSLS
jgi:hypothetical protein